MGQLGGRARSGRQFANRRNDIGVGKGASERATKEASKERRGGGGSENGEGEGERDVAVRETLCKEREEGKKEEKEKRPYLGILRRRRRPSAQIRSGGPCGTASAASADPSHRYRDVTADKITSLGGGVG